MKISQVFFIVVCVVEVSSKFLSLLYHLKMDNPIIVGKISDLKNKEMFQLFKDVNVLGQSINMITMFGNNSLQRSTGIIIRPDDTSLDMFNAQNVKKLVKVLIIFDIFWVNSEEPRGRLKSGVAEKLAKSVTVYSEAGFIYKTTILFLQNHY